LGMGPNPQAPIPNPQSPLILQKKINIFHQKIKNKYLKK